MTLARLASVCAAVTLVLILGGGTRAQTPVVAAASVDRNVITMGDPIKLTIVVEAESSYRVGALPPLTKFGEMDVLDTLPVLQGSPARGVTRYTFRYYITSFELGDHVVPAFEFDYSSPDGLNDTVRTTALAIRVRSVIRSDEDVTDIKPLKPQLDLPDAARSRLLFWGTVAGIALAVSAPVLLLYRVTRRRRPVAVGLKPDQTPVQLTLRELKRIADLHLPEKGRHEEHYALVAKAIRQYVSAQFGMPAAQRTARELYRDMERAGIERRQATAITEILRESEAVRFQRVQRHPRHAQEALAAALSALAKAAAAERRGAEVLP